MTTQSATMTESERMKLIKWAKKNGAARIAVEGVEIEFGKPLEQKQSDLYWRLTDHEARPPVPDPYAGLDKVEIRVETPEASESTKKAMAALRSQMDDPDVFATQSDEWANQTRLPRS